MLGFGAVEQRGSGLDMPGNGVFVSPPHLSFSLTDVVYASQTLSKMRPLRAHTPSFVPAVAVPDRLGLV